MRRFSSKVSSLLFGVLVLSAATLQATDDHLLISEALLSPSSSEFIEIANPAAAAISLDNYYLSDDEDYALLPGASGAGPAPRIGNSDFIVRFPSGASIPAGGVIVVALDGAGFSGDFGFAADFEIKGTDPGTPDMIAVEVGSQAGLTNRGESVVLFFWDGAGDLVQDVDMVNLGSPSNSNDIGDKSELSVDGPDPGSSASAYLPDASSMPEQASAPGSGLSAKRIAMEGSNETAGSGNGISGDDETSERIDLTWDSSFTAPNPGIFNVASPSPVVINEVDADAPGTDTLEFVELFGPPGASLDGLAVVFYNGSGDTSYAAFDLDGLSLDAKGFFVLGNPAVPNAGREFGNNTLQNGADAVALYQADAADFPNGTPVTNDHLVDAVVYDTGDPDDTGLLAVLTPGRPQVNEGGKGNQTGHANARVPDGGSPLDTSGYIQQAPTPGASNGDGNDGFGNCGDPAVFIHAVQGGGASSPRQGNVVVVEGVVVGDFQDTNAQLSGFFLQEEDSDADADPLTSEGIFVFDNGFGTDVSPGDVVRVRGQAAESFGLTELNSLQNLSVCSSGASVTPAVRTLPVAQLSDWEQLEGMLIDIPQTLFATENFNQGRFGEVFLSVGGRLFTPTHLAAPGQPANDLQSQNLRSRILLDDGSNLQNPLPLPPFLGPDNTLRLGDTIPSLRGVLGFSFGQYRVYPTQSVTFTRVNNRRPMPPAVGGTLRVATSNVLNYFTTIDNGQSVCGPLGNLGCRGADSQSEFIRQRDKIIAALSQMNADVVGLVEMENNDEESVQDLVDGLNNSVGAGSYDFIDTDAIGGDAIKVAIIYKPSLVTAIGEAAALKDVFPFNTNTRPPLAQAFREISSGLSFIFVVNHFKSKGSACDSLVNPDTQQPFPDPDTGDGQGNCNLTRVEAAAQLLGWLATDPTGTGISDILIMGDLNANAQEDPITTLKSGGFTDMVDQFLGSAAYSFVFDGHAGYLDHALASASLVPKITGVAEWHINADEPHALDYNDVNQPLLYSPDPFRASDHDPLIVGLNLSGQ